MTPKAGLFEIVFLLILTNFLRVAQAAPLVTSQNSTLSVPSARIASAVPGLTNLVGSNFMLLAVAPATPPGGRASLINSERWVRRYNGGPTSVQNAAYAVALRGDGSAVVTGYSFQPNTDYDFATISYAADGTPLWTNRYDGPAHGSETARLLSANASGDVWVVGDSRRYATNATLTDVAVIKYASNGIPLWTNRYSNSETNSSYPAGLAVDSSGNAYVKHFATYWPTSGFGIPVEEAITKYDALGNIMWAKHYPATAPDSGQDLHGLGPMALDDMGNLFVAGTTGSEHFLTGSSIVKFAADGTAQWTNHHSLGFMSGINLLSMDRQGNPVLTGEFFSNNTISYVVMKCSKEGVSLWTNALAGPIYDGGNVPQTVPDDLGNAFLIGGAPGVASPGLYQILKLSSNGVPLWTNLVAVFGTTNAMISDSAGDSAGNLYLAGYGLAPGTGDHDFVTVKYSGDGSPLWTNRFSGVPYLDDIPFALAVDSAGNVYVTGESKADNWDFVTIKYADLLVYTPPKNFTGSDAITCILTDNFGHRATGSLEVIVLPGSFHFNLSQALTRLTPAGMQVQMDRVPGTNAVVLEASADLINWLPILTNAPSNGSVQFLDPAATNLPRRFYRALQEQ